MKILIDVNIFMDILQRRAGWVDSLALVSYCRQEKFTGYVSALTLPILYFLRRRQFDEKQSREDTQKITSGLQIISLTEAILKRARESELPDFEDNLQLFSAKEVAVDYLITRNKKHFLQNEIAVATPEEFLRATLAAEKTD